MLAVWHGKVFRFEAEKEPHLPCPTPQLYVVRFLVMLFLCCQKSGSEMELAEEERHKKAAVLSFLSESGVIFFNCKLCVCKIAVCKPGDFPLVGAGGWCP